MWFLGLIVGLVIGAALEGGDGAVYGAALGALAGYALRLVLGRGTEARLDALEHEVRRLGAALEAAVSAPASQRAPVAPAAGRSPQPFPEFELPAAPPGQMATIQIESGPPPASPESSRPQSSQSNPYGRRLVGAIRLHQGFDEYAAACPVASTLAPWSERIKGRPRAP